MPAAAPSSGSGGVMAMLGKYARVLLILGLVALLLLGMITIIWSWSALHIYDQYVDEIARITGLNSYLVAIGWVVFLVPFVIGVHYLAFFRWRIGLPILMVLYVAFNLTLYYATRDTYFEFGEGKAIKWFAITPEGISYFDRPGVHPKYGMALKPVTPADIRPLELIAKGQFNPVDPHGATFFNPITGDAQIFYFRYPDGTVEFYDMPGFHPRTGARLEPVTRDVYLEWQESERKRLAAMGPPPTPTHAGPRRDPLEEKW